MTAPGSRPHPEAPAPADVAGDAEPVSEATVAARATRRDQIRQMTVDDIKTAAREQLTQQSAGNVSLRAVAREVGLAPTAISRYFDSQTALVAAVAVDAYHGASRVLVAARKQALERSAFEQFRAMFAAYRQWALSNRAEFTLIFATDQSELLDGPSLMTSAPLHEFFATPLQAYCDAVAAGQVDPTRSAVSVEAQLTAEMEEVRELIRERTGQLLSRSQIASLLSAWAGVQGFVTLEVFGQLGWFLGDREEFFAAHVDGVLDGLGLVNPEVRTPRD
jgi:AcrR family transcriptional regulator